MDNGVGGERRRDRPRLKCLSTHARAPSGCSSASDVSVDHGLRELHDVTSTLRRLRLAGLVEATSEGEFRWRVRWGERALRIAREAGVEVPGPEKVKAAAG